MLSHISIFLLSAASQSNINQRMAHICKNLIVLCRQCIENPLLYDPLFRLTYSGPQLVGLIVIFVITRWLQKGACDEKEEKQKAIVDHNFANSQVKHTYLKETGLSKYFSALFQYTIISVTVSSSSQSD